MKKNKLLKVGIIIGIMILTVFSWKYIGKPMIQFVSNPEKFREWVEQKGIIADIVFALMIIFQVLIAVIPGEPFEIVAGYAFGTIEGTFLCILATTIGSILVYWIVRKWGIKIVRLFFEDEKIEKLHFLKHNQKRMMLFLIVYTLPGTPKDLLSYFAGLTDISFGSWFFICMFGRMPSIITSTLGGDALGSSDYIMAILVFVVTLIISGIGLYMYNKMVEKHSRSN